MYAIGIQISDEDYRELVMQLAAGGPDDQVESGSTLKLLRDFPQVKVTILGFHSYKGSHLAQSVADQKAVYVDHSEHDLEEDENR